MHLSLSLSLTIFINFSPTSNHLDALQVENCDSNSRLVDGVDGDDHGIYRLERVSFSNSHSESRHVLAQTTKS